MLVLALASAGMVCAQSTAFTYQGRLTDGGAPANTNYDLQFTLWDSAVAGTQQPQPAPATLTKTNVGVTGGVFSVLLDFGVSAFPGADRFLEVGVRPGGGSVAFTLLAPRQQISSTPYALRTLKATAADSLSSACVGCVTDAQINSVAASKLTGTIPAASLPAGGSFIQNQNTTTPQTANFNISGNGIIGGREYIGGNISLGGIASQARDKGGWVKAMILVTVDKSVSFNGNGDLINPAIARCYNSQSGASIPDCGFKVIVPSSNKATTRVDFGFQVNDRFISVTPALFNAPAGVRAQVITALTSDQTGGLTANQVEVNAPGPYFIFVF